MLEHLRPSPGDATHHTSVGDAAHHTPTADAAVTFAGVPLLHLPAHPTTRAPAPEFVPASAVPAPPSGSGSLRRQTAAHVMRAHAAVLAAHEAVARRQFRAPSTAQRPAAGAGAGPVATAGDDGAGPVGGGRDAVVRTALAALGEHAPGQASGRYGVIWRVTDPDARLRGPWHCSPAATGDGDWTCAVRTGDRLVAELSYERGTSAPEGPRAPGTPYPPDARPLARTGVRECDGAALDALAAGDVARVLGAAYCQGHLPAALRAVPGHRRVLHRVTDISLRGGASGLGGLTASLTAGEAFDAADVLAAVCEGAGVLALHRGYHLTLPAAWLAPARDERTVLTVRRAVAAGTVLHVRLRVGGTGLYPRPYVRTDASLTTATGDVVADVQDLCLVVHGPLRGDGASSEGQAVRLTAAGDAAEFNELHLAHVASGDDPDRVCGAGAGVRAKGSVVRPRLPRGDMLMVDRGVFQDGGSDGAPDRDSDRDSDGGPGGGSDGRGVHGTTEYDVPADPWYCRESGSTALPPLALMEIALQPAGLLAARHGACAQYPDTDLVCRNLSGRLRLSRQADCRDSTVSQQVSLRSAADLPGALIHTYDVRLATAQGQLLSGRTTHGYFTKEVLAAQQGLDQGRLSEPWLLTRPGPPADVRHFDARADPRLGTGRMALLHEVSIVPSGGVHGRGYVLCAKPVDARDWFFEQHFPHDPVMPGSAGLQMLHQALQAFARYTPATAHLRDPLFRMAAGHELRWSYRGQILPEHHLVQAELHVTDVTVERGRVLLRADGDLWRDGLRIYHFDNLAIEALASGTETSPV